MIDTSCDRRTVMILLIELFLVESKTALILRDNLLEPKKQQGVLSMSPLFWKGVLI